jgi:hypothetical protein
LHISLVDNGILSEEPRVRGLGSIRLSERGGTWDIRSRFDGTEVNITVPLRAG